MKTYKIVELSKLSGLSRGEVKKHLIAQTLKNTALSSGYGIEDDDLNVWKNQIPDIDSEKTESMFKNVDMSTFARSDEFEEINISRKKRDNNWTTNKLNGIRFADFFCGAGGITLGLIMAGYEPVLGVEYNETIYQTYQKNIGKRFGKINDFHALDITRIENKNLIINYLKKQNIKLICGGFPCQGFSLSGSRVISDPRNTLYFDMLDIVKEVKPEYILMENVLGLLTIFGGKVIKKILDDYRNIGYKISFKELNAADYEVAQMRKRLIFIANRVNKKNIYPAKIISNPKKYITCGQILEKYKDLPEDIIFSHLISHHSEEMKNKLLAVPVGGCLYDNYNDAWKKCSKDKPSFTIKGNHGATNIHYELPRVITPREMAALQSFPDDYLFYGSKQSQLVQIGNAVPPYVARAIGLALKDEILK